jgi:hypothetical protein
MVKQNEISPNADAKLVISTCFSIRKLLGPRVVGPALNGNGIAKSQGVMAADGLLHKGSAPACGDA